MLFRSEMDTQLWGLVVGTGLAFLGITSVLLVLDLDRPDRFLYVMLRPNWSSWLVRGAYLLVGFGGILAATVAVLFFELGEAPLRWLAFAGVPLSALTAIYTAWLFQQAKGRSWSRDAALPAKFMLETVIIGSATLLILVVPAPIYILAALAVLAAALLHGRKVVQEPQLESLI